MDAKLQSLITKVEEVRTKVKPKALTLVILGFLFLGGFFASILWLSLSADKNGNVSSFAPFILMVACLALDVVIIIVYGRLSKKFKNEFKDTFDPIILQKYFSDGFVRNPNKGLALTELQNSGIVKEPDEYYSENYYAANIDDKVSFVSSDYDFVTVQYTTDSEGHTTRHETHYRGKAFIFTFPRKFDHTLSIYEKGYASEVFYRQKNKNKNQLESVEFNKKFKSYADDPTFMFYILTPQVQMDLLEFDAKINSNLVITIKGNKLYMYLQNYKPKYAISPLKRVTETLLKSYIEELTTPLKIFDYLDIDKDKFLNKDLK